MLRPNVKLSIGPYRARFLARIGQFREALHDLTMAERQVFDLMGLGLTNAEIAGILCIDRTTARTHVKRIHSKLEVDGRELLVAASLQLQTEKAGK